MRRDSAGGLRRSSGTNHCSGSPFERAAVTGQKGPRGPEAGGVRRLGCSKVRSLRVAICKRWTKFRDGIYFEDKANLFSNGLDVTDRGSQMRASFFAEHSRPGDAAC